MKAKTKKGCGCIGAGGCCGIIVITLIVIIVMFIAGILWVKHRVYLDESEKITELAGEICDYKLPDNFKPLIGIDFDVVRFALFVKGDELGDQNSSTVIFFDTTITNIADYFDDVATRIVLSSGSENEMKVRTIEVDSLSNGDTKILRQEQLIYIEEEYSSFTIYKGSFPKDDRIVIAWYMAVGMTNTPANAKAIINSIGKSVR